MTLIFNPPRFNAKSELSIMLTHNKKEKDLVFKFILKQKDVSDETLYDFIKHHDFSTGYNGNDVFTDPICLANIFRIMNKYNLKINSLISGNIIFHGITFSLILYYDIMTNDNLISNIKYYFKYFTSDNIIILLYMIRIYKPYLLDEISNIEIFQYYINNSLLSLLIYDTLLPHQLDYLTIQHH